MINLVGPINSGTAAGSAGSATANNTTTTTVKGRVLGVYVLYNDSPPSTTDVTIATLGTSPAPPTNTLLTLTNANTSGWFYPRQQIHDAAGAGATYDGTNEIYEPAPVHDRVKVTIAGANSGDSVDVWLMVG